MKATARLLGLLALLALAAPADASVLLSNGDFTGTSHINENHSNQNLTNIILDYSNLSGTNFQNTIFNGGSFISALLDNNNLRNTSFLGANLTNATVTNGNLRLADFSGANLAGVDFTGSTNADQATWTGASYSATTILPAGLTPAQLASMTLVAEPSTTLLLLSGLCGLALLGSRSLGTPRA